MDESAFNLLIVPAKGALPIRLRLAKAITTIGSGNADICIHTVPREWAVITRSGDQFAVISGGSQYPLETGRALEIDGVSLQIETVDIESRNTIERLASELTSVDDVDSALEKILSGCIRLARADSGAVILADGRGYTVARAQDREGQSIASAGELLSDTIVRDVLGTGEELRLSDIAANERYAGMPSVVSLHLRAVICLPLRSEGKTLGALFLGRRQLRGAFGESAMAELKVLAALSMPFLAQLQRPKVAIDRDSILGESAPMQAVRDMIARVGPTDLSIWIKGPSGSGKELVAQALHRSSERGSRQLIAINCAAVPEGLLAGELFGYRRGAFTGADSNRAGVIEAANGSTLFLDEVADMPLPMQAALLRVLEEREVRRLGDVQSRSVDFRLVAASHKDLHEEVAAGRFREDLLFRLHEVTVELPPLRERGDDVGLLAHVFLRQIEKSFSLPMHVLSDRALEALKQHSWPGNVRELRAAMRRAAVLAARHEIEPSDLRLHPPRDRSGEGVLGDLTRPLADARDAFVQRYIEAVLERHGGNREDAAQALGIGVRTLYRHLS